VVLDVPTVMPPFDIHSLCGSLLDRRAHSHWRPIRRIRKSPLYATKVSLSDNNDNSTCRPPSRMSIMPSTTVQSGSTGGSCSNTTIGDHVQVYKVPAFLRPNESYTLVATCYQEHALGGTSIFAEGRFPDHWYRSNRQDCSLITRQSVRKNLYRYSL
jgi:hypothetical protein